MHFDCDMNLVLLHQAIYLGLCRNKSTFTRIRKVDKKPLQYFTSQPPEQIEMLDYSNSTDAELEADINKWSRTAFPNNSRDVQLYKVRLIKKPDGKYCASFVVSHLAFDAYSLMVMASDILSCYKALRNGTPIEPSKIDPITTVTEDQEYLTSEKKKADLEFWENEYKEQPEPQYVNLLPRGSNGYFKGKRVGKGTALIGDDARYYQRRLSKERVDKINELASKFRVSPFVLFLIAIRNKHLLSVNKEDDFYPLVTMARRASLKQKRSSGTRVMGIPIRMKFSNDMTFEEACIYWQGRMNSYMKHCNLPIMEIEPFMRKYYSDKKLSNSYHAFNVTYNPYFVASDDDIPVHFNMYSNGGNTMPVYLTIMSVDNSGELLFNYDYMLKFYKESNVEDLHNYIERFFDKVCENPKLTLNELFDI